MMLARSVSALPEQGGRHLRRSVQGVALLEMILTLTMSVGVALAISSAWGSLMLWMGRLESQATLLREATTAREYLERDLLSYRVVASSDPTRLQLVGDKHGLSGRRSTIQYRVSDGELRRKQGRGRETLVATRVLKARFLTDPARGKVVATLELQSGSSRLRLLVRCLEAVPETLFVRTEGSDAGD